MGGGATQTEGHRLRGVLLHDGRGGPGPVAEEDRGSHHQHRSRQPGAARSGQLRSTERCIKVEIDLTICTTLPSYMKKNNRYSCTK